MSPLNFSMVNLVVSESMVTDMTTFGLDRMFNSTGVLAVEGGCWQEGMSELTDCIKVGTLGS